MERVFDDWKKVLADFKSSVGKDLKEIRKAKAEVQRMRQQIKDELNAGKYIHDEHRIVISAPEIIIGNVDKSGELFSTGSTVIIRGGNISMEGSGEGGMIESRACSIRQIATDPGSDGNEDVARDVSSIVNQAKVIVMQANNDTDVFASGVKIPANGGIRVHADTDLILEATIENDTLKNEISESLEKLKNNKDEIQSQTDGSKKKFESVIKDIEELLSNQEAISGDEMGLRTDLQKFIENGSEFRNMTMQLYETFCDYSKNISRLAELTRKIDSLNKRKDKIPDKDSYLKQSNGSNVYVRGERINIDSVDGENNYRDDAASGISLHAKTIDLNSLENNGTLKKEGYVNLRAENIDISTLEAKNIDYDDKMKLKSGEYTATGNFAIHSKNISLEALDYEVKDSEFREKALTKDGKLSIRLENIDISTNDTDGKSAGSFSVNAKSIDLKGMDVDKEKRTDKSLTQGSTMLLLSEKMYIGAKDKDSESKLVQMSSETIGQFAKNTFEVQQGEKKAVLQMDGGKMSVGGDSTGIYGKTTINDATEVKGELKAPKASIDNVEAKSSFKSPNISDGMAVGGGGGGGSLSPKLQKEDMPKDSNN